MTRRITPRLALLLALLFAVLAVLVGSNHYFQTRSLSVQARGQQITRNLERIRYYDEALTGSARLAAATGDDAYVRRYHSLAPQLDAVIAETLRLAGSARAEAAIDRTSDANQALIAMEERAFVLERSGERSEASALLTSADYSRQKAIYASGFEEAASIVEATVRRNTDQIRVYRELALGIGGLGAAVLMVAGVLFLRLARERERMVGENERQTRAEASRRVAEVEYFETQQEFAEVLQVTRREGEAHGLIKRHLERTMDGADITVLRRNNSDNRLEVMTELPPRSQLATTLVGAEPDSCAAIRLGRGHQRDGERKELLECGICGVLAGASLCVPSLVGGEVIGSVLVQRENRLVDGDRRRVQETVSQAAPVLANLRTLALAETQALTDTLTGLPNRRSIENTLKRMVAQSRRTLTPLAAVMLDLDHFKQVNDIHGHDRGDEVLAAVGSAISASLRDSDFAGRFGGEEFLVLLADADRDVAVAAADRLRRAIASLRIAGEEGQITASLGVAVMPDDAGEASRLLRTADRALYTAKRGGRNRIETAAEPMAQTVADTADRVISDSTVREATLRDP